jgi:hypothetical protein
MKLAFKNRLFGYSEKDVPVEINILTLKNVCKELGIDFYGIDLLKKKEPFDFMCEFLFQAYISACKESFTKPKYTRLNAIIWYENLSQTAQKELAKLISDFYSEWKEITKDKKKE